MFVPIILESDKTTVSVGTGNNEYYPLYISIGNVHNNVCHAHWNALALLGFLSIPKCKLVLFLWDFFPFFPFSFPFPFSYVIYYMDISPFPWGADMSSSTWLPDRYLMVDLMVAMRRAVYKQDFASCTVALYFVLILPLACTYQCTRTQNHYLRASSLIEIEQESLT